MYKRFFKANLDMKRPYVLNIGLTVKDGEPLDKLDKTLEAIELRGSKNFKIATGEREGKPERTISVRIYSKPFLIESYLKNLCKKLNQDAISVYDVTSQQGMMVYNPDYKGERYKWDAKYFHWDY